jgi:hypothetical protein
MRAFIEQLRTPPAPITRRQWIVLAIVFAAVAATRFYALSHSLADWDEALFCLAVGKYDVADERPHAPGYPLFIAAAKVARNFTHSDFRALQAVTLLASILLLPAFFYLARELRLRFAVALAAAMLLLFFPTVWYFGGTGFSDVPSLLVTTVASALLLHGGRDRRMFFAGMFVAALATGIRPQTVMITAIAGLAAAIALRSWKTFLAGCAIGAVTVAAIYLTVIFISSNPPHGYFAIWKHTSNHVKTIDSYHNPHRPPLAELAHPFLVQPFRGGGAGTVVVVLVAIGLIESIARKRDGLWLALLMFVPVALFSWVMLDITSMTRYAVTYLPLYALFAASGLAALCALARHYADAILGAAMLILIGALVTWVLPTLKIARASDAPVVEMFRWLRENVPPNGPAVFLDNEFYLQSRYLFEGRDYTVVFDEDRDIPQDAYKPGNYLAVEGFAPQPQARVFTRYEAGRLFEVARPRYGAVSLIPMESMVRYGSGWNQVEKNHVMWWRWTRRDASMTLQPFGEAGELRLTFIAPGNVPRPQTMTLWWNGTELDKRVLAPGEVNLRYAVPSRRGAVNELRIAVDPTLTGVGGDQRELGLMLQDIGWQPLRASSPR